MGGDIVRLGVAIKTAERNAAKCRDKIAAMETEQTEAEAEKKVRKPLYSTGRLVYLLADNMGHGHMGHEHDGHQTVVFMCAVSECA